MFLGIRLLNIFFNENYLLTPTYFCMRFSSLNWRQSKMKKQTLASLKADFYG